MSVHCITRCPLVHSTRDKVAIDCEDGSLAVAIGLGSRKTCRQGQPHVTRCARIDRLRCSAVSKHVAAHSRSDTICPWQTFEIQLGLDDRATGMHIFRPRGCASRCIIRTLTNRATNRAHSDFPHLNMA